MLSCNKRFTNQNNQYVISTAPYEWLKATKATKEVLKYSVLPQPPFVASELYSMMILKLNYGLILQLLLSNPSTNGTMQNNVQSKPTKLNYYCNSTFLSSTMKEVQTYSTWKNDQKSIHVATDQETIRKPNYVKQSNLHFWAY